MRFHFLDMSVCLSVRLLLLLWSIHFRSFPLLKMSARKEGEIIVRSFKFTLVKMDSDSKHLYEH